MNNADFDYGRDQNSTQQVITEYKAYFNNIKTALTGEEKNAFITQLSKSWEGEDGQAYINKVKSDLDGIIMFIDKLPKLFENAITTDFNQFNEFQKRNASQL